MSSESLTQNEQPKVVHLPLGKLEKCDHCLKSDVKLRFCSSCGERVYCSEKCQQEDWSTHKPRCGKTDRIDITRFYPLLATIIGAFRIHSFKPNSPGVTHKILNSPNPGSTAVVTFPDNSSACLLLLGEEIPMEKFGSSEWWPAASSPSVRSKMFRRLVSEGYLLPSLLAVCIGMLAEMYTTTSVSAADSPDGKLKRRLRLQYHRSPIADFGIAKGSADVKHQDKFAYYNVIDHTFTKGQDPDDHYWIYFTTVSGEDFYLDCGMFTFNFCLVVNSTPYAKHGLPDLSFVPGYFRDRVYKKSTPNLQTEKGRFSVLRNPSLHEAIRYSMRYSYYMDTDVICEFMDKVAGRTCDAMETELLTKWCNFASHMLSENLVNRDYINFPAEPQVDIETDPGEMDDMPDCEDEDWWKYMKKWNKKQRQGEITSEQLGNAFRAWTDRSHDERLKLLKKKKIQGVNA